MKVRTKKAVWSIVLLSTIAFTNCKTTKCGELKKCVSKKNITVNSIKKNTKLSSIKKENNFIKSNWPNSLQEGWLDSTTAQALLTGSLNEKEITKEKCRQRLAWLLFLDSYNANREYQPLAQKLASSSTFKSFGREVLFEKEKNDKYWVIVKREATDLTAQWNDIMKRFEKRDGRLKGLRKKKNTF